jgi:hypothetical protein
MVYEYKKGIPSTRDTITAEYDPLLMTPDMSC